MINLNDDKIIHNKNLLINPNFGVIQGTASGTLANSLALPTQSLGYLGETNWCIAASGGTPIYAFSSANESVTFTGAASTTAIHLLQRLESKDLIRLANKLATITFSFETSNSLLTSVNWSILRPTTTADVHGTIGTPTHTTIASGTVTVNSTLTRYSVTVTLPAQAALGAEIRLSVGAQTSGTWVVARLQLEEGSVVTNFNCGDYPSELLKCKRYYELFKLPAGAGLIPLLPSGVGFVGTLSFIEKFTIPTFAASWSSGIPSIFLSTTDLVATDTAYKYTISDVSLSAHIP